jgi:hypothetical protein
VNTTLAGRKADLVYKVDVAPRSVTTNESHLKERPFAGTYTVQVDIGGTPPSVTTVMPELRARGTHTGGQLRCSPGSGYP